MCLTGGTENDHRFSRQAFCPRTAPALSFDSVERFIAALIDSQVDLNPHQVDVALFAFCSPLSKGAVLVDEVGLDKA